MHRNELLRREKRGWSAATAVSPKPEAFGLSVVLRMAGMASGGQHVGVARDIWTDFFGGENRKKPRDGVFDPDELPRAKIGADGAPILVATTKQAPASAPAPSSLQSEIIAGAKLVGRVNGASKGTASKIVTDPTALRHDNAGALSAGGMEKEVEGTDGFHKNTNEASQISSQVSGGGPGATRSSHAPGKKSHPLAEEVASVARRIQPKMAAAVERVDEQRQINHWWMYGKVDEGSHALAGLLESLGDLLVVTAASRGESQEDSGLKC